MASVSVEEDLERLRVARIDELRAIWRRKCKSEPPKAFGPDLLRRSLAHKVQEAAYGGLSPETRRLLKQLIKAYAAKPTGKIEMPKRIMAGSVLVREWKGRSHRVMVMADGFAYDGVTYRTLSEIARLVTGTQWNGPRFFGLRAPDPAVKEGRRAPAATAPAAARTVADQRRQRRGGEAQE